MDDVKASMLHESDMCMQCKVGREVKFWIGYNQLPYLSLDTIWESDKYTKTLNRGEPISQPYLSMWPQGCMTQTRQYRKEKHMKRSTKELPPWNGQ